MTRLILPTQMAEIALIRELPHKIVMKHIDAETKSTRAYNHSE